MRRIVGVEDYFDAGVELLVTQGPGGIKVGALCTALGVTTGSFYGYFASLDDFVARLLTSRLSRPNRRLLELAASDDAPEAIMARLRELLDVVPHDAEKALRAWAPRRAVAAALQHRLDTERGAALAAILGKLVPADRCGQLAEVTMALLIGYQHMYAGTGAADRDSLFDQFETMVRAHQM
ncbi:TetR/AcrR family transcriptional regulator [Mycolicibacterium sp. NCC-Tsukiji]|jgi:AcrR family transcriptional regulator|uniref:TetR/AcrR family transcriptional regulator n=1 Tax=Mycobacteriaceae TaxID=1762 RepID=UPI000EE04961|nr:TetR/AcrR family transcriptional regulator [Mycolicibacterium sp. NCC-Tsukiji]GCA99899.1 transcriptional regulator [Mycolicibacterium sp. NCC-Tsukiji]